jgi:hypothetical protein
MKSFNWPKNIRDAKAKGSRSPESIRDQPALKKSTRQM